MRKTKLILGTLLILAFLLPTVSAAPLWSDPWFIEHATTYVETFPDTQPYDIVYEGQVTTGWHPYPVDWHKHVELFSRFKTNGYIYWTGRVYDSGEAATLGYQFTRPHQQLDITVKYLGGVDPFVWNGEKWVHPPRYDIHTTGIYKFSNGDGYETVYTLQDGSCVFYPPEWTLTVTHLA